MFTLENIREAHAKVKSGAGFPQYIQEIKTMGITAFETWVKDSHTTYFGKDDYSLSSPPVYENLHIAAASNLQKFAHYLLIHQQGQTDYLTFCRHCAETGIEKWFADLSAMTCTYYSTAGDKILVEAIPSLK